jgi:hypothetical protein
MGFEGIILYGSTGSTASTQLLNVTDVAYNLDIEEGNTTVRGDSTTVPIETMDPTVRKVTIEWTMISDTSDASLAALRAAAYAGTGVALRTKDYAAGKGFDGDCFLKVEHGMPIKGEATHKFTATPSRSFSRAPVLYV